MALDALILGPFVFTDFAVPEALPFGGKQQMHVHKMPGGSRVVDTMGPDDNERYFTAIFRGSDALGNALTLDAMRRSGAELPYSNGVEARTVVIASFEPVVKRFNHIEFAITLITTDNAAGAVGASGLGAMVLADLGQALALATANISAVLQ